MGLTRFSQGRLPPTDNGAVPPPELRSMEGVACCPIPVYVARCSAKGDSGSLPLIIDVKAFLTFSYSVNIVFLEQLKYVCTSH